MEAENKIEEGIDIIELLQIIWKRKWIVIILAVIMMTASYVRVKFFTDDTYTSSGLLYVSNRKIEDEEEEETTKTKTTQNTQAAIKASDISASRQFSETYVHILGTRSFMKEVEKDLNGKFSWSAIRGMTSVSMVDETELLSVSVTARNPDDAYEVAKSVIRSAPSKLTGVFKNGEVIVVDDASVASVNPRDTMRQVMLGAFFGAVLGIAYIFIRNFFDTKVRKSEDVERRYNVYVLGEISQ